MYRDEQNMNIFEDVKTNINVKIMVLKKKQMIL